VLMKYYRNLIGTLIETLSKCYLGDTVTIPWIAWPHLHVYRPASWFFMNFPHRGHFTMTCIWLLVTIGYHFV